MPLPIKRAGVAGNLLSRTGRVPPDRASERADGCLALCSSLVFTGLLGEHYIWSLLTPHQHPLRQPSGGSHGSPDPHSAR